MSRNIYIFHFRLPALYSTDDGSLQGFLLHVGGKKIKNKNCWPADVGGKKNKKGNIDKFSVKMAIFRGKKDKSGKLNPACQMKMKIKKS